MSAATAAPTTLFDLLERHHALGGARTLLITPEGTFTSADVIREAARVAKWLLDTVGLERGDRVVIDQKNGLSAVAALFAVTRLGGIVVAATPQWTVPQIEHVIRDSEAKVLITNDMRAKQLASSPGMPSQVLVHGAVPGTTDWDSLAAGDFETIANRARHEDPAILIYTSGSTGAPKGVVHPHKNLVSFARIVAGYLENTGDDRLMWLLGWSFGYGLSQLLTMCQVGGCLIVPASMLAADVVKAHDEHRATAMAQVPYGWDQLVTFLEKTGRQLTGLRYLTNAGDGPTLPLLDRVQKALPDARMILMYGQTECLRTTYLPAHAYEAKRGSMGLPIPEVEVFVMREDGQLCEVDEPGELLHHGALLAVGYWRAEQISSEKFRQVPSLRERVGDALVLHTGDIVRRDADGYLWYVGRSERMIKSSGFRFSPFEIEAGIRKHPSVRDVAVYGIDDPQIGQAVEAAVVCEEGSNVTANMLLGELRKALPRYMLPRRVHFVAAVPRNPNGKLRLTELKKLSDEAGPAKA